MIKVCYINAEGYGLLDPATGDKCYSGSEIGIHTDAFELAKDPEFDVQILAEAERGKKFKKGRITVWTIEGSFLETKLIPFMRYRLRFWRKIKEINADIYVMRAAPGEIYFLTALFCKIYKRKFIQVLGVTLKKNIPLTQPGRFLRWNVFGLAAVHMAGAIVAITRDQTKQIPLGSLRKTRVVYTGKHLAHQINTRSKRNHILWVGSKKPEKKPELFIQLAERLADYKFVMIRAPEDLKLPPNVAYLKHVPHNKIDYYYSHAVATVSTSSLDWNSHANLESWKNGTPVIALTIDTDENICKYNTGFHSRTFHQLVEDVKKIMGDRRLWENKSKNSLEYMRREHDIRKQIEKYKGIFRKLISK